MPTTLKFPKDILRLLYWVFFKPFTLEKYVSSIEDRWTSQHFFALSLGIVIVTPISLNILIGLVSSFGARSFDWYSSLLVNVIFEAIMAFFYISKFIKQSVELSEYSTAINTVVISVVGGIVTSLVFGVVKALRFVLDPAADIILHSLGLGLVFGIVSGLGSLAVAIFSDVRETKRSGENAITGSSILHNLRFSLFDTVIAVTIGWLLIMIPLLGIVIVLAVALAYASIGALVSGLSSGIVLSAARTRDVLGKDDSLTYLAGLSLIGAFVVSRICSIEAGIIFGISTTLAYFRLPLYLLELFWQILLVESSTLSTKNMDLHLSPLYWDEHIWLPLFGLDWHLIAIGKHNRQNAQQSIALVAQSFRQQWAATNALIELTAYDVERAKGIQSIANIAEQFTWLPPTMPKDLENVLPPIREIAEFARGALESDTLYNKQTQLRNARTQTQRVREGLALSGNRKIASRFGQALQIWEQVFDKELASLQTLEAISNVYVAGSPLAATSKVFKGRRDLFVALERELATPAEQRPTVLLFGARRSGKTSVIKQMPNRLGPNVVPVEIDLQSATAAEDASGLLAYIADQIKLNAINHRRIQLPMLTRDELRTDPYMAFLNWLTRVEEIVGERWILLNLDEYEHLTEAMDKGRLDERVFQFFRGLIQHHPRITVLLSGSHTFEDLSSIWSNYLINVRTLRIGALKEEEARELIVKPIPDFPLEYEPAAVDHLIQVTGCQPYLLQATCRDLVNALNEANRMNATLVDTEGALDFVLTSSVAYFQDLWSGRDSDDTQRTIMRAVATNQDPKGLRDPSGLNAALRKLCNRDVLEKADGTYHFRVELVRRWVEQHVS